MILGIALLLFLTRNYFLEKDEVKSPIPEINGVKVIIVTPTGS